jgi:hypothetical protein
MNIWELAENDFRAFGERVEVIIKLGEQQGELSIIKSGLVSVTMMDAQVNWARKK